MAPTAAHNLRRASFRCSALAHGIAQGIAVCLLAASAGGAERPVRVTIQAQPRFEDLSTSHLSYRSAALAVAAGAMTTQEGGRFEPTAPATGADLAELVARVADLAR